MEPLDAITRYWPVIGAFVASIVWFIRLESTVKWLNRDLDLIRSQRSEDIDAVKAARGETNALIEKMEVKLERGFEEIRNDIKELLRQERQERH